MSQLEPSDPGELRKARKAKINHVQGKGKTERRVYLSRDARSALADYLETEYVCDADEDAEALFLSARGISARGPGGRMSPRAINLILEQIGKWHDAEVTDPARKISPLQPHNLRHTFAF